MKYKLITDGKPENTKLFYGDIELQITGIKIQDLNANEKVCVFVIIEFVELEVEDRHYKVICYT